MRGIIHGKYQLATSLNSGGLKDTAKRGKRNSVGVVRAQLRKIINDGNLATVSLTHGGELRGDLAILAVIDNDGAGLVGK